MKWILFVALAHAKILPPAGVLPMENLKPPHRPVRLGQFKSVLMRIENAYQREAAKKGSRLRIIGQWKNSSVELKSSQVLNRWWIRVSGGLAKRPEMTADGLTLLVCHELAHHLSGLPFPAKEEPFRGPASNPIEDQADKFAEDTCAPKLWEKDLELNAEYAKGLTAEEQRECHELWPRVERRNLCFRIREAKRSAEAALGGL